MSEHGKLATTGRHTIVIPIDLIKVGSRMREEEGDIGFLAESINRVGLIQPITVNQDYELLAGHRRILAHQKLGKDRIEAIIRATSSKIDMLEIELIENIARKDMTWQEIAKGQKKIFEKKASEGKWSVRKQADYLQEMGRDTVWRNIKMAEALEMIPDLAEHKDFSDAWKDLKSMEEGIVTQELVKKVPQSIKAASKWASDHYHVGDAFTGMAKCKPGFAHFAEIDPPYAVDLDKRKSRNKLDSMKEYEEVDSDEYINFYERTAKEVFRILRDDSFAVFWFGWDWFSDVRDIILSAGFKVPTVPAIWVKGGSGQTASPDTTLGSCHEPFWLARKGQPKLRKAGHGNVFDFSPVPAVRKIHPTERPIELMKEIVDTICFPGSAILVPFLGSGVTLRAAYQLNCTGFGWDLSEENKRKFLERVAEDKEEEK